MGEQAGDAGAAESAVAARTRPRLVLASGSPRRRELLAGLGLDFEVRPVDLDESRIGDEPAEDYVLRLAREKAEARAGEGEIMLAADTTVVRGRRVLGKPVDPADARHMLREIADRDHRVLTGVAVHEPASGRTASAVERTRVTMSPMSDEEIAWYVATGEPLDKAGAYGIQGLGALFVEAVEGNYTNVVGLPLVLVYRLFRELGWDLRQFG